MLSLLHFPRYDFQYNYIPGRIKNILLGQQTYISKLEASIEKDKQVTPYAASYTPPIPLHS